MFRLEGIISIKLHGEPNEQKKFYRILKPLLLAIITGFGWFRAPNVHTPVIA